MTDLNENMTPEAMMQAQIERLTAERDEARAKAKQQRKVIAKVYNRVSGVVIDAVLGPDRVYLGSTNDFDLLCDLKDEWDAHKIMGEEIMTSEQEVKAHKTRAEKAERELAEHRAQTDALIAAAYEDAAKEADKAHEQNEYQWKTRAYPRAISCETVAERIRDCVPADAKAALETRDRAMRNEGRRHAAEVCMRDDVGATYEDCHEAILSLIEKEPEGKGDE